MVTKSKAVLTKALFGIVLFGLVLILLLAGRMPAAHAQEAWTETPTPLPTETPPTTGALPETPAPGESVVGPCNVSGAIGVNTTWSTASCIPYIVTGNILVNSGARLTIGPGVEVRFNSGKSLQVNGELVAQGTGGSPILFTSNAGTPAAGDWGYILFTDSSVDASFDGGGNYASGSIIQYATLEYAGGASVGENGALRLDASSPFIDHNTIRHNAADGIHAWNGLSDLRITNNTVTGSLVGIYAFDSNPFTIRGNTVSDNAGSGIYVGPNALVSYNTAANNNGAGLAIYSHDSGPVTFAHNIVTNNKGAGIVGGNSATITDNTITGNWGSGVCSRTSSTIARNTISNNNAEGYNGCLGTGGGIVVSGGGPTSITDNLITGNTGNLGGGVFVTLDYGEISRNLILDNQATTGGGIYATCYYCFYPLNILTIAHNIIAENTATTGGGGLYRRTGLAQYNAILYNTAPNDPAVQIVISDDDFLSNTLVGNIATGGVDERAVYVTGHPLFNDNNLFGNNTAYTLLNACAQPSGDLNAANNWWGTTSDPAIQALILDWLDYSEFSVANYASVRTAPNPLAPIAPPSGLTATVSGTSINLNWVANPESDLAGYMVYWDSDASGYPYAHSVDVGNVTSTSIPGLTMGTRYYVAVTAYDTSRDGTNDWTDGNESWFSAEASLVVAPAVNNPPVITESDPAAVTMSKNGLPDAFSLALHATDADGDLLTWSVSTPAGHGYALATGSGNATPILYAPDADYVGSDSFAVQVNDGFGGTDSLTVNVTILASDKLGGRISVNTIWTLANSPYTLLGNVLVGGSVRLTIEPGVEVRFNSGKSLQVSGELLAQGTGGSPILFTSNALIPAAGDWGYILFRDGSADASFDGGGNYLSGSIIQYATLEYAGGISVSDNGALRLDASSPFIDHNTIRHNAADGIHAWNGLSDLRITNNTVTGSLVGIYAFDSNPFTIRGNTVSDNAGSGIYVGPNALVSYNTAANNNGAGLAIYSHDSGPVTFAHNIVTNNKGAGIVGGNSATITDNTITGNWGSGVCSRTSSTIARNTISNNNAEGYNGCLGTGGGIVVSGGGPTSITDNLITGNTGNLGGGVFVTLDYGEISRNLILDNQATTGGGIYATCYYCFYPLNILTIAHNILAGNSAISGDGGLYRRTGLAQYNAILRNTAPNNAALEIASSDDFLSNTIVGNVATGGVDERAVYVAGHPLFNDNNLFGNSALYALMNANAQASGDLNALNNWWGTTSDPAIQDMIYDWLDYSGVSVANYTPYRTGPNTLAPLAPPTGLSATVSGTSINLSWTANGESDVAGYKVYWDTDPGYPYAHSVDVGNVTGYTIPSLTVGTRYYIAVTAYDTSRDGTNDWTDGNESWFSVETSAQLLTAPTGVAASDGTFSDKVQVTWDANVAATYYEVYRAESAGGTKSLLGSPTGETFDDTTAAAAVTYYYWVKACNTTGCSDFSAYNTGWRNLTAPTGVAASDGTFTDKVQITWNASAGATSYRVYRATSEAGTKGLLGSPAASPYDDTSATPGVTYYYWVRACSGAACSDFSAFDTGWRNLLPPTNVQASDGTFIDKVQVTWNAAAGATSYNVFRAGCLTCLQARTGLSGKVGVTGTSFDDTTATPGISYYYFVQACRGSRCSDVSSLNTGWRRKLVAPVNLQASDGTYTDKVRITWDAVSDATSYKVFRADDGAGTNGKILGNVTASPYADATAVPGVTYWYWVKACNGTNCSDFATPDSGWRMQLAAPTNVQASDGTFTNKVRITWTAVGGATSYKVYRAESAGGVKTLLGSPVVTTYDDTTAIAGTTYYYWVQACQGGYCSEYSAYDTGRR